jgi:hypothetical protein
LEFIDPGILTRHDLKLGLLCLSALPLDKISLANLKNCSEGLSKPSNSVIFSNARGQYTG